MENEKNKVQNETTTAKATNDTSMDLAKILSDFGFTRTEQDETTIEEKSEFVIIPEMFVQCKTSTKNSKTYKDYIVHGRLRNVNMTLYARPRKTRSGFTDVSSYKLLDVVFATSDVAYFAVRLAKRSDPQTQRIITTSEYVAYFKDEATDEFVYAPLTFETSADRSTLRQILMVLDKKHNLNLPL
ncbi:MAG: hypothetical protein K2L54_05330 [Clostridiales bacterium]|nr:hypothetical protein [Clostridiales bacterium]